MALVASASEVKRSRRAVGRGAERQPGLTFPGSLPSPRMADKTIESIYASAIVIDEAYVTTSGSASRIDMTAALAAQAASSAAALAAANAAQVTANAAVAKADVQQFNVNHVDLIDTSTAGTYTFIAEFAGTNPFTGGGA